MKKNSSRTSKFKKKKSRERKGYRSHQLQEDEVEKLPNRVEPQTWSRHGWIVSGKMGPMFWTIWAVDQLAPVIHMV